jgi:hypothetical protein
MSTLQHTLQPALRNRLTLIVLLAGAAAALTIALIVSSGSSVSSSIPSGAHTSQAQIQRQLESVAGARYGTQRPGVPAASTTATPQSQLQAVAGARFGQPVGIHARR